MDLPEAYDPEIDELSKDVKPEKVLDTMDRHQQEEEKKLSLNRKNLKYSDNSSGYRNWFSVRFHRVLHQNSTSRCTRSVERLKEGRKFPFY